MGKSKDWCAREAKRQTAHHSKTPATRNVRLGGVPPACLPAGDRKEERERERGDGGGCCVAASGVARYSSASRAGCCAVRCAHGGAEKGVNFFEWPQRGGDRRLRPAKRTETAGVGCGVECGCCCCKGRERCCSCAVCFLFFLRRKGRGGQMGNDGHRPLSHFRVLLEVIAPTMEIERAATTTTTAPGGGGSTRRPRGNTTGDNGGGEMGWMGGEKIRERQKTNGPRCCGGWFCAAPDRRG